MTPTGIRLAVLDMAGTTVADDGSVEEAFLHALRSSGWSAEQVASDGARRVRDAMGRSKIEVFTELLGNDHERAARADAAFRRHYAAAVDAGDVHPVPGAEEAIRRLRAGGVAVCLTTGFAPETRDRVLSSLGWEEQVDLALSPSDSGRGRPYPDMVLTAVLRLRVDDVRAVAVAGDTVSDLEAGWHAGASVVAGVLTGAHNRAMLSGAPHTHVLGSVAELPDLLLVRGNV